MKRLLFSLLLLASLATYSQSVVNKPKLIFNEVDSTGEDLSPYTGHTMNLYRIKKLTDTSYVFAFNDSKFKKIAVKKELYFKTKNDVKGFAKTLKMAQNIKSSEAVENANYKIDRLNMGSGFGSFYNIYFDNGYCTLTEWQSEKLLKVIDSE